MSERQSLENRKSQSASIVIPVPFQISVPVQEAIVWKSACTVISLSFHCHFIPISLSLSFHSHFIVIAIPLSFQCHSIVIAMHCHFSCWKTGSSTELPLSFQCHSRFQCQSRRRSFGNQPALSHHYCFIVIPFPFQCHSIVIAMHSHFIALHGSFTELPLILQCHSFTIAAGHSTAFFAVKWTCHFRF